MPVVTLAKDATIRDVWFTLLKPQEYVRVVFGHMLACRPKARRAEIAANSN